MRRLLQLLIIVAITALSAAQCMANDSIVYDNGGNVYPIKTDKVRMVSEKITVTMHDMRKTNYEAVASVHCDFVFENTSDEEITVDVGFPTMKKSDADEYDNFNDLDNFRAFIGVKEVLATQKKEVLETWENNNSAKKEILETFRYWYIWEVKFPPNKKLSISNSYNTNLSMVSNGERWFDYILKTGANWKGKIEETVVEVVYADEYDLKHRVTKANPPGFRVEGNKIIWVLRDYVPSDNIRVEEAWDVVNYYLTDYPYAANEIATRKYEGDKRLYTESDLKFRPATSMVARDFNSIYSLHDANIYNIESLIEDINMMRARALRNEIFARHGRYFQSRDLSRLFEKMDWYKYNPNYSLDLLNDIERKNVQFISDYEKKMGWRYTTIIE